MKYLVSLLMLTFLPLFAQSNCNDLRITTDNRTGDIRFECPLVFDMQFSKTLMKNGDSLIQLYLQSMVPYTNTNEKGCTLFLSDGSTIEYPEQVITVTYKSSLLYKYNTTLNLSPDNINRLLSNSITDFKMHIHNSTEKPLLTKKKNATLLLNYVRCVVKGVVRK